jgi:hypothetical protein
MLLPKLSKTAENRNWIEINELQLPFLARTKKLDAYSVHKNFIYTSSNQLTHNFFDSDFTLEISSLKEQTSQSMAVNYNVRKYSAVFFLFQDLAEAEDTEDLAEDTEDMAGVAREDSVVVDTEVSACALN